ncbi:hypothetical protein Vretifemale_4719, partial [Volvox reticuliferus]
VTEFKHELAAESRCQEQGRRPGGKGGMATRISFGGCIRRQCEVPDLRRAIPSSISPEARHLQGHTHPRRGGGGPDIKGQQDRPRDGGDLPSKRRKIDHEAVAHHMAVAHAALASARCATAAAAAAAAAEADDDEAVFAVKERRRHAKDIGKLAPVMLGRRAAGGGSDNGDGGRGLFSRGFECVGGLQAVIQSLREMVLLPLLHPGLMEKLGMAGAAPPRGILLHGLPGTGKTLVVRALAGEVARTSPVPVALFARGGADVLGKYHGDAERTLRLLFEEARRRAPSIIFLDELDALAPRRSVSAGGADQIYASVVATLLALMDGVADRGQVVVIGATNRPDNLDPALRRPGRFDREVAVGLPSREDRAAVLRVHTAGWKFRPSDDTIERIAEATEGFAGADLAALCCSAVMAALRRTVASAAATTFKGPASPKPASEDALELLLNAPELGHRAEGVRQCAEQLQGPIPQQQQYQTRQSQGGYQDGVPDLLKERVGEAPRIGRDVAMEDIVQAGTEGPTSAMTAHGRAPPAASPTDTGQLRSGASSSDGDDMRVDSEKEDDVYSDRKVKGNDTAATGCAFDSQLLPLAVAASMPMTDGQLPEPVRAVGQAVSSDGRRVCRPPVVAQTVLRDQEAGHPELKSANLECGGRRSTAEVGAGNHTAAVSEGAAALPKQRKGFASILRCVGEIFDCKTILIKKSAAQHATAIDVLMKPQTAAEAVSSAATIRTTATRAEANAGDFRDAAPAAAEARDCGNADVVATRHLIVGAPVTEPAGCGGLEQALDDGPSQASAGIGGEEAAVLCSPASVDDTDLEAAGIPAMAPTSALSIDAAEQTCLARKLQQVQGPVICRTESGGNAATFLKGSQRAHQAGAAVFRHVGSRSGVHTEGEFLKGVRDGKGGSEAEREEEAKKDLQKDVLSGVRVEEADWELALAAAPQPCSR